MPRSGSTYLCDILNSTGLFNPLFEEKFNSKINCVDSIKNDFLKNPENYKFLKIQPMHFKVNELSLKEVQKKFNNLKIIKLYRKSFFDSVLSLCVANLTKTYAVSKETSKTLTGKNTKKYIKNINKYLNIKINIDDKKIIKIIKKTTKTMIDEKKEFDNIVINDNVIEINYDDLMSENKILDIFKFLNIDIDIKKVILNTTIEKNPKINGLDDLKNIINDFFIKNNIKH